MDTNEPPRPPPPSGPPPGPGAAPPPAQPPTSPGQPAPWQQQPPAYGGYGGQPSTNGYAIASLVLGIAAYLLSCLGLVAAPLAIIFGYKARRAIDGSQGAQGGRGFTTAGIVLGWIWVGLAVVAGIVIAIVAATGGFEDDDDDFDDEFGKVGVAIESLRYVALRLGI